MKGGFISMNTAINQKTNVPVEQVILCAYF